MTQSRERIETALGIRLPDAMIEDAGRLAASAAKTARTAAANLPESARDPDEFLVVLESLAGDQSGG
ncbi:MAG: hypothetical protein FJX42_00285 [Alphaproteobacteria bacterium]|nr:hypothetical protein [Alphaproteobacteria bacterium]